MTAATTGDNQSQTHEIIRRIYPLFGLILFALTWRLWTPQDLFPQVSLVSLDFSFPAWLEWICFLGIVLGLAVQLFSQRDNRFSNRQPDVSFSTATVVHR